MSRQAHEKEKPDGRVPEFKPYEMGLQITRRIHSEMSAKYEGEVFRRLAAQRESRIEDGHLMPDHLHMMIAIPPKYAVGQVVGCIKGKSAVHLARVYGERKRNFVGQHFWARGNFVSTVNTVAALASRPSRFERLTS